MRRLALALMVMLAPVQAGAAPAPKEPEGARAFMQRAVAFAMKGEVDPRGAPYLRLFTQRLARAMVLDGSTDEVRVIDYEVICQCQDNEGWRPVIANVRADGAGALATLRYPGKQQARFRLVQEGGGWRIADVEGGPQGWLLRQLDASNAELLRERRKRR